MTNREFFVAIASNTNLTADLREHAQAQVDKMDTSNAKNSPLPSSSTDFLPIDKFLVHILNTSSNALSL